MLLRLKKRGDKVLEKALVVPSPHDDYDDPIGPSPPVAQSSQSSRSPNPQNWGTVREETIQEAEEPLTPSPQLTAHSREAADTGR